jgi:transaldolase
VKNDLTHLRIKLFADTANLDEMLEMKQNPNIKGFTTNPSIMRKEGVENYRDFAKQILFQINDMPISFEVVTDDLNLMIKQGIEIGQWAENVYVKIPITNSQGASTQPVISELTSRGYKVNVTAVMTSQQVAGILGCLDPSIPSYVSVFAGRIADTGINPRKIVSETLELLSEHKSSEVIWASSREVLNIFQAQDCECHIITATKDILAKLPLLGKDLTEYSRETAAMFIRDAMASNYSL